MINIRFEPIRYMLLNGLMELSHEFKETLEPDDEYNPNWQKYIRMEDNNTLRGVAMRENGDLIGFASVIMDDDSHQNGKQIAVIHDIFVTKSKRGHAPKMQKFIEENVFSLGVHELLGSQRMNYEVTGKFYEAMGYKPKEVLWAKGLN